jgi:DNA-binding CsgD family transcriptional regulator
MSDPEIAAQVAALRLLGPTKDCVGELPKLSEREVEILKWTVVRALGRRILNTSEHTVNPFLRGAMTKLAVGSRHQAGARARALRLF